jgi:hypothetical protein
MVDKNVGWLVPAAAKTQDMRDFEHDLSHLYKGGNVLFPDPQYLGGNNANINQCVQNLVNHNPPYDVFAVAGSTGVDYLAQAQNAKPIVQVVGGNPAPNNGYTRGYYIAVGTVACCHVYILSQKYPNIKQLTMLVDPTSETWQTAYNAALNEANTLGIQIKQVQASTPTVLSNLTQGQNPIVGMFMLAPSGMFYNDSNNGYIITLVENAPPPTGMQNVPAIYPEHQFKAKHRAGYPCWTHGHHINKTYKKAAILANYALQGNPTQGGEAPDKEDDSGITCPDPNLNICCA